MKNQIMAAVIGTAVLVGGGAFYGGMKYGTNNAVAVQGARFMNGGGGDFTGIRGGARGGAGGGFVSGDIIALDHESMTIQLRTPSGQGSSTPTQGGGSRIVFFGASTQVVKTVPGSLKELTVGEQVTTTGTTNSDGSVTAESIQIRPRL